MIYNRAKANIKRPPIDLARLESDYVSILFITHRRSTSSVLMAGRSVNILILIQQIIHVKVIVIFSRRNGTPYDSGQNIAAMYNKVYISR